MVKPRILTLMLFSFIGSNLAASLMMARSAAPAIISGSVSPAGKAQCLTFASGPDATLSPPDALSYYCTGTRFPEGCAMLGINDLLCHHRIRSRSRFDSHSQNGFSVARDGHIPLNAGGMIVATRDAEQPVMFLSAATARGPPWAGDQSLYLFDNAPDRLAPHSCTAPLLSEFQFHDSSSVHNATRPFIHSFLVNGAGALFVAADFPIKYDPTVHQKKLL